MPAKQTGPAGFILSYDIRHPARLQKIHRHLSRQALALQKSVFLLQLRGSELESLLDEIAGLARQHEDDLRLYPLAGLAHIWLGGKHPATFGSLFHGNRSDAGPAEKPSLLGRLFGRQKRQVLP